MSKLKELVIYDIDGDTVSRDTFLYVNELKEENEKLKQQNEKLKKCVEWYKENEIVSLDKYIEASNCGQFKYATNLKANETLKEIEESK